jgi:hypothetical protein
LAGEVFLGFRGGKRAKYGVDRGLKMGYKKVLAARQWGMDWLEGWKDSGYV